MSWHIVGSAPRAAEEVASALRSLLATLPQKPLTVLCVGSDRSTGDALGPLVGTMLTSCGFSGTVLGTLDNPVHAGNLRSVLLSIDLRRSTVIGVDACLGVKEEVGCIIVGRGPMRPGLGVGKKLPPVGDIQVAGVVNVAGFMEHVVLQCTRLGVVAQLARIIASAILKLDSTLNGSCPAIPLALTSDAPLLLPLGEFFRQR